MIIFQTNKVNILAKIHGKFLNENLASPGHFLYFDDNFSVAKIRESYNIAL